MIGETVHVATLEDLIVYKLIAGRTRDVADIEEMVETQRLGGTEPDWEYVRGHARAWDVEGRLDRVLAGIDA